MAAITVIVVRALATSGGLKAGTPLEIASMPVSAALPEENARSSRNSVSPCVAAICSSGGAACSSDPGASPTKTCTKPMMITVLMEKMKK